MLSLLWTTVPAAAGATENSDNKNVTFKNCASFADCISKIKEMQIDNAEDIDLVMPMYNLLEYSNNCSKKLWSSW